MRKSLAEHLAARYSFEVIADELGYVIRYPDLPGCLSQVDTLEEVPAAAEEIRILWIESEYEAGDDIPEPRFGLVRA